MCVYYQNQHENPCQATVAFRAVLDHVKGQTGPPFSVEIDCPPAGFGVVRIPFPVPENAQGLTRDFQVGATVSYPEGKGKRLLKRDGFLLRTNADFTDRFNNLVGNDLVKAGLFMHAPVSNTLFGLFGRKHRRISGLLARVTFPRQVASRRDEVDKLLDAPEHKTMWKLGDPVPETAPV
jgi:hypothetical protein